MNPEPFAKAFRTYLHPTVLYLLAAICWLWLVDGTANTGSGTFGPSQLALVALVFLSSQWGLMSPCGFSKPLQYKLWVYMAPFLLGVAGVGLRHVRSF